MKMVFLLCSIFCSSIQVFSQSISEKYEFITTDYNYIILICDSIKIVRGSTVLERKSKRKDVYMYSLKSSLKIDSLLLPEGYESASIIDRDIISIGSKIFFCAYRPQRLVEVDRETGKLSTPIVFNRDSVSIYGLTKRSFISKIGHVVSLYDPKTNSLNTVFDFVENADDLFKEDIGTEHPVGIGGAGIFSFVTGDKILIKTGYNESDGSFACIYYIVNATTGTIEKLPFSHFGPLLAEPKDKLKNAQHVSFDSTSVDISEMYFDVHDSIGYISFHFPYDEKIDSNHITSRLYMQDAFVVNRDFQLIGRALERRINVRYPIYEGGRKVWNVVYSKTDSLLGCFFKINLNYALEKSFHDLFYNKPINENVVRIFDQYELSLLRNFIFAKHNYRFKDRFYQAYFNTFTFYSNEDKRMTRRNNVDISLTAVDKNNLLILTKLLNRR